MPGPTNQPSVRWSHDRITLALKQMLIFRRNCKLGGPGEAATGLHGQNSGAMPASQKWNGRIGAGARGEVSWVAGPSDSWELSQLLEELSFGSS